MDIASYLKSQGMKYTWFGAALAEDIDRLWEFLDNGQDRPVQISLLKLFCKGLCA